MKKKVLFVAFEGLPFIKTGGLADVVYALPKGDRLGCQGMQNNLVEGGWNV